jgi:hypothetical protein
MVNFALSASARLTLKGEDKERWKELCAQAAVERDPEKLLELAQEINRLLEENERRLGITLPKSSSSSG